MTMLDVWKKWRAEILRGSVIFAIVVGLGLTIVSAVHKMEARVASGARGFLPQLAQSIASSAGGSFDDPGRTHGDAWSWHSKLEPGQTLAIRNINGPVEVTAATGTETVVTVEKSWLTSDPHSVTLRAVPTAEGTTICALWPGSASGDGCATGRGVNFTTDHRQSTDVAVKFVVQLGRGVKIDVGSVNGDVSVAGAESAVRVASVSGDLSVETAAWPVDLTTVSGDITARTGLPGADASEIKTVSGDVNLDLPDHPDVLVNAHTLSGDVSNDFSIPVVEERFTSSHSMVGTLGKGGAKLDINTVSGDITVDRASAPKVVKVGVKGGVTAVRAAPHPTPAPPAPPAKP